MAGVDRKMTRRRNQAHGAEPMEVRLMMELLVWMTSPVMRLDTTTEVPWK